MAKLVSCLGLSHAPGQTGSPELVSPEKLTAVQAAWAEARRSLAEARPDIVVIISNDHFQNFFPMQPAFCIGTGDVHQVPARKFEKQLRLPSREVTGAPGFAHHLLQVSEAERFPLAFSDELHLMDEVAIPEHFLGFGATSKVLPVLTNCLGRNVPSPSTFVALGQIIRRAIDEADPTLRVAVLGTGGLAHDPLGPNWCLLDEDFDRRFLSLLEAGESETLLREFTLDRIFAPGRGGTPEILNWFAALGVVGVGSKAKILAYVPVAEWATGMGYAAWKIDATTSR